MEKPIDYPDTREWFFNGRWYSYDDYDEMRQLAEEVERAKEEAEDDVDWGQHNWFSDRRY